MSKLEPHELSKLFPPISDEDFGKLAADIKLNGLHQPIVRYQGKILDGNNRYRACELVKIAPGFTDFEGDDAKARNFVISANIHRRHLSPEQRRDIIATLLKAEARLFTRLLLSLLRACACREGRGPKPLPFSLPCFPALRALNFVILLILDWLRTTQTRMAVYDLSL